VLVVIHKACGRMSSKQLQELGHFRAKADLSIRLCSRWSPSRNCV